MNDKFRNKFIYTKNLIKNRFLNSIIFKGGIAAFDQGLLSAVNFLVHIILIKTLPKDEYGYYAFAISLSLYLVSLQNATVNTPMTVLLAAKRGNKKHNYINSLYSGQFIILLPTVAFSLIALFFIFILGWKGIGISITTALIISSGGILWREFLRSYFFAEEKPLKVLKFDFLYSLIFISLIGIAAMLFKLSVPIVIIFMGFTAAISSALIKKNIKFNLNWNNIKEVYLENWQYGRWSLIGVTTTHIQSYSYLYLIGMLLGSFAMAEVSASRILLIPSALVIAGWGKVVRPHGAKLREEGRLKRFYKELIFASIIFCVIMFLAVILINIFSDSLINLVFTEKYKDIFKYLFFWAAIFAVGFIRANASFGLQVIKKFKYLAGINVFTLFITLTLSYILIKSYGITGALIATLIGSFMLGIFSWTMLTKEIFFHKT